MKTAFSKKPYLHRPRADRMSAIVARDRDISFFNDRLATLAG
jgi:hypothetical protein